MVNMNISPSGVVIGAMPPLAPGGRLPMRGGQAFADLLARPVDVGAVLEIDGDVGQRVFGSRAQQALVRDAEQFLLDRHGEAGFDFLRRHARRLQDDLDLRRRDVGKGIDRQATEGLNAGADQHGGQHQQQQALGQRKADQRGQHYSLPTPVSIAFSPETPLTATPLAGLHAVDQHAVAALADDAHRAGGEAHALVVAGGLHEGVGLPVMTHQCGGGQRRCCWPTGVAIATSTTCPACRASAPLSTSARSKTVWLAASTARPMAISLPLMSRSASLIAMPSLSPAATSSGAWISSHSGVSLAIR